MALNPGPIGTAIANYIETQRPVAGHAVTDNELELMWQGIMALIYADIKATMNVLPAPLSGTALRAVTAIPGVVTSGSGAGGATTTNAPGTLEGTGSVT